jgi:type I restriction enzyme S subunit
VLPRFFLYVLRHDANTDRLEEYFTGTGIKHLTGKGLSGYSFPLPPRTEQERIVAKVDELMALCDELEASVDSSATASTQLLDAALRAVLPAV